MPTTMRKCIFLILAAFVITANPSAAQQAAADDFLFHTQEMKDLKGTFVIEVVGTRAQPSIPKDLADQIKQIRDDNGGGERYLFPKIRLVVFSETEMKDPAFVPPDNSIRYVSE